MLKLSRATVILIIFVLAAAGRGVDAPAPLRIEDALTVKSFAGRTPIALSPDGQLLAYTLTKPSSADPLANGRNRYFSPSGVSQDSANTEIWMVDTRSGASMNLTEGKGVSWGPVWSPDGRYLAFYSDRSGTAHLWIWERTKGDMRQLSDAIARPFWGFQVAQWSPDSRTILTKLLPEHLNLEQALDLIVGSPSISKENEKVSDGPTVKVFSSVPERKSIVMKPSSSGVQSVSRLNLDLADLALIDIATGTVSRLARSVRPRGYWLSPDGRSIAFTNVKEGTSNSPQTLYDLMIEPVSGAQPRVLVPDIKQDYGTSVSWSPDGTKLAYTVKISGGQVDAFVVTVQTGETRNVTPAPHPPFDAHHGVPAWDGKGGALYLAAFSYPGTKGSDTVWKASLDGKPMTVVTSIPDREILGIGPAAGGRVWSPDGGRSLILMTRNNATKQQGFWKVNLSSGQSSKLFEQDMQLGAPLNYRQDTSAHGQTFVYLRQDAKAPDDIWITGADFKNQKRITHVNPQLEKVVMGASRVIEWKGENGQLLRGALLLPSNYEEGKRYPLIVWVYGGFTGSDFVNTFGFWGGVFNLQLFATRGYAVLYPDAPVRRGSPAKDLADAVLPGVDKVIELGIADPARLGIAGQSYGGYSTLALITQTDRFKAAVVSAGIGDLISYYGKMEDTGTATGVGYIETGQGNMHGTPWEHLDEYIENSPVFHINNIKTPLLITVGTRDSLVGQADEVFVGLRRLGQEVEYVRYLNEGHVVEAPANQKDFCERRIKWFDDHLKKPEKTESGEQ